MPLDMSNAETEREGLIYIHQTVNAMHFIYRDIPQPDRGLDCQVELKVGDTPTAQFIMIQSKAGSSYIRNEKSGSFDFYSDPNHLIYWRGCPNPVLLHVYDPRTKKGYCKHIQRYLEEHPEVINTPPHKITFDTVKDEFTVQRVPDLRALFQPRQVELEDAFCASVIRRHSKLTLFSVTSDRPLSVDLEKVFITLTARRRRPAIYVSGNFERYWESTSGSTNIVNNLIQSELKVGNNPSDLPENPDLVESTLFSLHNHLRYFEMFTMPKDLTGYLGSTLESVASEDETVSLNSALHQYRALVVTGDPGAGKTTLMKYIALAFARNVASEKLGISEMRLPILIAIRDLNVFIHNLIQRREIDVVGPAILPLFLENYFKQIDSKSPFSKDFFQTVLDSSQGMVLFDGLDEVADTGQRARIAKLLSEIIASDAWQKNRYVITSRVRGYDAETKARLSTCCGECHIRPFEDSDVEDFTRAWYEAVTVIDKGDTDEAKREAARNAATLVRAIRSDVRVRELAHNPLLLSVLAMVHQRNVELPRRRARLYEECTDFLLSYWDELKDRESATALGRAGELDRDTKRALLEPIALWLHEQGEENSEVDRTELEVQLASQFKELSENEAIAKRRASEFLHVIADRSGLLVERSTGVFAFAHLTFQEYLAARAIVDRDDRLDVIAKHFHDPWWREVILLTGSLLSDVKRGPLTARKNTKGFLSRVRNAGTWLEEMLRKDLLLAVRCLSDMEEAGVESSAREALISEAIEAWKSDLCEQRQREILETLSHALGTTAGQQFVGALITSLESNDPSQQALALDSVAFLGSDVISPATVACVCKLGQDRLATNRRVAARACASLQLTSFNDALVEEMLRMTTDQNPTVRHALAESLGCMRQVQLPTRILNALLALTKDGDESVRTAAVRSLGRVVSKNQKPEAVARVFELLSEDLKLLRYAIVGSVADINEEPGRTHCEKLLIDLVRNGPAEIKPQAIDGIAALLGVKPTAELVHLMVESTKVGNIKLRRRALAALRNLDPQNLTADIVQLAIDGAKSSSSEIRRAAIRILGQCTANISAGTAINLLEHLAKDGDEVVRLDVVDAVGRFRQLPYSERSMAILGSLLEDKNRQVQTAALRQLPFFESSVDQERAAKLLLAGFDAKRHRITTVRAMGRLKTPVPEKVLQTLTTVCEKSDEIALEGVRALGRLGPKALTEETQRVLLKRLRDKNEEMQAVSLRALSKMGGASDLLDQMLDWGRNATPSLRIAAIQSLALVELKDDSATLSKLSDFWSALIKAPYSVDNSGNSQAIVDFCYEQLKRLSASYPLGFHQSQLQLQTR